MEFTFNEIDTDGIRRDTFRGDEYLVAPVTAMKAMKLDRGYVPQKQVEKSVPAWNGTPVTLFHPANAEGQRVSANSPHVAEKTWLGYVFNADSPDDGETLDAEIWIDINNAESKGGLAQEVVETLENGEKLSVSTAYYGDKLEAGEYDGERYENVIGNLRPDHLAMLPGKEGKCSVEDGCMAGAPAVNEELNVTITDDPVEPGEGEDSSDSDPESNVEDSMGDNEPEEHEAIGKALVNAVKNYFNEEKNMERDEMIKVLSNQHGFKEESLDGMGDNCLERTYNSFVEEEEPSEEEEVSANEETEETEETEEIMDINTDEIVSEVVDQVGDRVDEMVEQKFAENEASRRKEELIGQILDNSDDYEKETLEETPESVLENMAEEVATEEKPAANWAGSVGAQESPAEDYEDFDIPAVEDEE